MLKGYKTKTIYNYYVQIIVDICWNTWFEIDHRVARCNLDDPANELMLNNIKINGVPHLLNSSSGANAEADSNLTIRDAGIVEIDKLEFSCIQTDQ
ncbi:hypothetical protein M9Y10_028454 [Tritrichomonas musculus]|uniref:Uncharacterized protein n=1 Tax=Tritrichomonas musculus TaxID=1915356 RepID=A0ABR2KJE7_9EUKA